MARGEFQIRHGYPRSAPGQANLALACNFVGQTYDCLAFTIEMPFRTTTTTRSRDRLVRRPLQAARPGRPEHPCGAGRRTPLKMDGAPRAPFQPLSSR